MRKNPEKRGAGPVCRTAPPAWRSACWARRFLPLLLEETFKQHPEYLHPCFPELAAETEPQTGSRSGLLDSRTEIVRTVPAQRRPGSGPEDAVGFRGCHSDPGGIAQEHRRQPAYPRGGKPGEDRRARSRAVDGCSGRRKRFRLQESGRDAPAAGGRMPRGQGAASAFG